MGALVKPGSGSVPSYSSDIDAFLASANNAAAREAIEVRRYLDSLATLSEHTISLNSLASNAYAIILDLSGAHEVVCGNIYGPLPGTRITVNGTETNYNTLAVGRDNVGNLFGVFPIPPIRSTTSLKIEVRNLSGGTQEYGARIFTRTL